jgi:hypothetical protein
MRESTVEQYLVDRVKALGGEVRKVRWIGRNGAPDRLVMLPMRMCSQTLANKLKLPLPVQHLPATIWVELKAPGEKCKPHQVREHERMRRMGQRVEVVDSFERVDELLA